MHDWPPEDMRSSGRTPQEHLLAAIAADDHAAFYAALPDVRGDINKNKGQYLRAAADARNMLFMKELALAGADIGYASAEAERERSSIQKNSYWDDRREDFITRFENAAEEARYNKLGRTMATLQQFQQNFTAHIAPAETLKNQQRILEEIEALKQQITELRDGKPIEKGALHVPAALRGASAAPKQP